MEDEKLIAALRNNYSPDLHVIEDMQKAADALERLTAQNAEKAAEIERWKTEYKNAGGMSVINKNNVAIFKDLYEKTRVDRDRLQAELDAAVEDFESAAHNGNILCEFCGADCIDAGNDTGGDTDQCGCFVYRGKEHD